MKRVVLRHVFADVRISFASVESPVIAISGDDDVVERTYLTENDGTITVTGVFPGVDLDPTYCQMKMVEGFACVNGQVLTKGVTIEIIMPQKESRLVIERVFLGEVVIDGGEDDELFISNSSPATVRVKSVGETDLYNSGAGDVIVEKVSRAKIVLVGPGSLTVEEISEKAKLICYGSGKIDIKTLLGSFSFEGYAWGSLTIKGVDLETADFRLLSDGAVKIDSGRIGNLQVNNEHGGTFNFKGVADNGFFRSNNGGEIAVKQCTRVGSICSIGAGSVINIG